MNRASRVRPIRERPASLEWSEAAIDRVLARLAEIEDEDLDLLEDDELDERLAVLGYDLEALGRNAAQLRERLLARDTPPAPDRTGVVRVGRWDDRGSTGGGDRAFERRAIRLHGPADRWPEVAALRAHLRRVSAPTGLGGRLGLSCELASVGEPAALEILLSPAPSEAGATPPADRPPHREHGIHRLRCRDRAELGDRARIALAEWFLEWRLDLVFTPEMRPPHRVPPECTTLCVSLGGGRAFRGSRETLSDGSDRLWNRVAALIGEYGATLGGRFVDIAFFHFAGEDRHARAVKAGDLLIRRLARTWTEEPEGGRLPRFDLLRVVVDDVPPCEPADTIRDGRLPAGFGFLVAVSERAGSRAVAVTETVHDRLGHDLRRELEPVGDFRGVSIHERNGRSAWPIPVNASDADDVAEIADRLELLSDGPSTAPHELAALVEEASDGLYERLRTLLRRLEAERDHRGRVGRASSAVARRLVETERRAWDRLEAFPTGRAADRRRPILEGLEAAARRRPRAARGPHAPSGSGTRYRVSHKIGDLLGQDDVEVLSTFASVVRQNRDEILDYLMNPSYAEDLSQPSRERIWHFAELLVAEDFRQKADRSLLRRLATGPLAEARLRALYRFVHARRDRPSWSAEDELRAQGAVVNGANARKLWLARLLTSTEAQRRTEALSNLPVDALWMLLAYVGTPVEAVTSSFARVTRYGDEATAWIATSAVVDRWVSSGPKAFGCEQVWRTELDHLCEVVVRLTVPLERLTLDRLRMALTRWTPPNAAAWSQWIAEWEHRLAVRPADARFPPELSARLSTLPLGAQWHLARHGHYLRHFVCHDDERIARATLPHIEGARVERVVSQETINDRLLEDLLEVPEMFHREEALEALVRNPKCDPGFAIPRLRRLSKVVLLRLIAEERVHPGIRAGAEDLLQVRHFSP